MMRTNVAHAKKSYADLVFKKLPSEIQQKIFDNVYNDYNKDKQNFMDILIVKNHLIRLENEYDYDIETEREILFKNMKNVLLNNTSFIGNLYEYFEEYLTSYIEDICNGEIDTNNGDELFKILRGNRNNFYYKIFDLFRFEKKETKEEVLNQFNDFKDIIFSNDISYDNPNFKKFLENRWYDDTINEYNYHLNILEEPDEHSVKKLIFSLVEMTKRLIELSTNLVEIEFKRLYDLITTG